jgi:hypothetical protein
LAQQPAGLVRELLFFTLFIPLFPSHYVAGHDRIEAGRPGKDRGKLSTNGSHAAATASTGVATVDDLKELEERDFTPR